MASRLASIILAFAASSHGLSDLSPRNDSQGTASGKFVKFPVIHSTNQDVFSEVWAAKREPWSKRGIETLPLSNRSDVAYYARLEIGNPAQPNFVQLDTGSFELWVNPDCTTLAAASDARFCRAVGSYAASKSSSSRVLSTATKTLRYGIGSATIQYVTDDITFEGSGTQLQDVQFGVAVATQDEFSGILGIGHGENVTTRYKNFVDELQDQGVTATKAFSLALGSKSEQEGVIIFGGVDTGKFAGALQSQPIIPAKSSPDGVPRYWIQMNSMQLVPPTGARKTYANSSMAVFLDSGATLTLLPKPLADAVAADFGATGTDSNGFYSVDCKLNSLPGTLDFAFPGVTIQVPYREIIRELVTVFGTMCYLGISANADFVLLGDSMLRSAYAVFDQTNNAVHLAQYVNCGTNEVEITAGLNMSSLTGKCDKPDFRAAPATTSTSSSLPSGTGTGTGSGASSTASGKSGTSRFSDSLAWYSLWAGTVLVTSLMTII